VRRREMCTAMAAVGVDDVHFLGWPDGGLDQVPTSSIAGRIGGIIADVGPDLIVTFGPDGITGHPDHVATHHATTAAWRATGAGQLLYATSTTEWLDRFRDLHDQGRIAG